MTLQANSTFLPVLDDLLSPDFRPVLLPAQTPQTPNDIVAFGGGKLITNAYGNITFGSATSLSKSMLFQHDSAGPSSVSSSVGATEPSARFRNGSNNNSRSSKAEDSEAATKIQNWWKSKRSLSIDMNAERAKHSIRHNRTEDHIRYLETEVNRLKSALSSERKIRSLQLEAIRSLWNQMQRISTANSSENNNPSLMTRSVPNGLPKDSGGASACETTSNVMTMSLNTALDTVLPKEAHHHTDHTSCSCSKEVQNLREVFTQEISQLRGLIHQLTTGKEEAAPSSGPAPPGNPTKTVAFQDILTTSSEEPKEGGNASAKKRPGSLNIVGISNSSDANTHSSPDVPATVEDKKIAEYANQMASKLVDDAVEDKSSE